jgi:cytochrome P450
MSLPPTLSATTGWPVLKKLLSARSLLTGLEAVHARLGPVFQIRLPGFQPTFVVGPEFNRQLFVQDADKFQLRNESDPVCRLLGDGLLVVDGEAHRQARRLIEPYLQRSAIDAPEMAALTAEFCAVWQPGDRLNIHVEMRKLTLVILVKTLFSIDLRGQFDLLWEPILAAIQYISPGAWLLWPEIPRRGKRELAALDAVIFHWIADRRACQDRPDDLLTQLIEAEFMDDQRVRDHVLTLMIAGHDTSTALLTWTLALLADHPEHQQAVRSELLSLTTAQRSDPAELARLPRLNAVIKESLRLYPPIHVGNRLTVTDVQIGDYQIPAGSRVMASIYLSQRQPEHWERPDSFCPARFDRQQHASPVPFSYIPFGAGPRSCIGATFAQIEARVVLAQLLTQFALEPHEVEFKIEMGATLYPAQDPVLVLSNPLV